MERVEPIVSGRVTESPRFGAGSEGAHPQVRKVRWDGKVQRDGSSKDARYEAERASIPLTLMDLDDLVRAILEHYERMDADSQRLVSLRKIYWPG